jgi:putative addiction module component (TIGR02574 family)
MTKTQSKIVELFKTLPATEQRELAEHLYESASAEHSDTSFSARLSTSQRAELERSIAEADRGEGSAADEVFDRLAKKHGFARG